MMKISFQKLEGDASLGVAFYWRLVIDSPEPLLLEDNFIPELFCDYFYIQQGQIQAAPAAGQPELRLPQQCLRTLHTRRQTFLLSAPLDLFGARLRLRFAEIFWQKQMPSHSFLQGDWVNGPVHDLTEFAAQIDRKIRENRAKKTVGAMLSQSLEEAGWLENYSPRHQRRMYKSVFGLSKKELKSIKNLHSFLAQNCDFSARSPRIIDYVNPEVYYDQPHLNRAFKKMTGYSLLDYFESQSIIQDNLLAASYNEYSET